MKHSFFALLLIMGISLSATAHEDPVKKEIARSMSYPETLRHQASSQTVWVHVAVEPCGSLQVLGMNASNHEFEDYVRRKIEQLRVNDPGDQYREIYLKIQFEAK